MKLSGVTALKLPLIGALLALLAAAWFGWVGWQTAASERALASISMPCANASR
jgi:hypothetical protein